MKVVIAGPRALSTIDDNVKKRLNSIIEKKIVVLLGDANGIDKTVQAFLSSNSYEDVIIYATKGKARNNIGDWLIKNVEVDEKLKGFNFYVAKDLKMVEDADYGFMVWNGKSKGTLNNIINLTKQNKKVLLYYTPHEKFYTISTLAMAEKLAIKCGEETKKVFYELVSSTNTVAKAEQLTIFDNKQKNKEVS